MAGVALYDSRYDDSDNEIEQELRALEDDVDGNLTLNGERIYYDFSAHISLLSACEPSDEKNNEQN